MKNGADKLTRNPEASQKRILDAALKEFSAKGFAGARVDSIARRARINKRMLYHYYGNKEGLFREILRRKIAERSAWMASAPENPFESLPYWHQLMCQDPDWIRLLEWEALQWVDKKVIDEEHRKDSIERAVKRIRIQQSQGTIPRDLDAAQLLLSVLALTAYPLAFPQLSRLATGMTVTDPRFQKERCEFLKRLSVRLQGKNGSERAAPTRRTTLKKS